MPVRQWGGDSDLKERRQAEFLVHDFCPWNVVEEVAVGNVAAEAAVRAMLATASQSTTVAVRPHWYY